uniref:Uncharacterized protein n=1 Tax=Tanacetum cinerariifolium TaxID=118510 RepID=A0A6L2MLD1_TANCI|nr:hypothetical protein [Tanacetum cinerariifolium]
MSLPMTQIFILILKLPTSSTNPNITSSRHTRVTHVEVILTTDLIIKHRPRLSMSRCRVTIKTLVMISLHISHRVCHSSILVVSTVEYPIDQSPLYDDMSLHEMLVRSTAYLEEITKRQKHTMGDEDSSTTLVRETDQFIKSGEDDLVPIPRESEKTSDDDSECNMLDISLPITDVRDDDFVTLSNPLFDTSCYDNLLFDKEF